MQIGSLLAVQAMLLETTILGTEGEQLLVDDPLNLAPVRSPLYCEGIISFVRICRANEPNGTYPARTGRPD